MQGDNLKNYLHLHLIVFIWGFTAVIGKLITISAFSLVWYRMTIAVVLMLVYALFTKVPFKVSRRALISFVAAGLVIALHWFTFFEAIKVSNISITLACLSTGAFFASLLESAFYGKRIVWYELFMGFIMIIALSIIIYGDFLIGVLNELNNGTYTSERAGVLFDAMQLGKGDLFGGVIIALISACLSATFAIINGRFAKEHNAVTISLYELLGGIFFFSLYLLFSGQFTQEFFVLSSNDWLWLFILGSVCTGYAQIGAVKVMKTITAYTMMLTINLEPVYGIILALIVFKESEKMSSTFYIGAAIILITVIINGILKNRTKKVN
ncbi:DMT family transporter [Flavobacterium sp. DG1-102-2]|uniref:DMT family transporter n=1 Tax=Flavobacterium sp. DG1-102-2 TaxID=3081663 RepID=UPI002949AEC1|nr:DMT family transporter [Flavobacterium sp. DG1-102-2]MDV6169799.1 DMT family transporter [Flavobacterium sp. DG1-102-2]